jgi:hypothetical protein
LTASTIDVSEVNELEVSEQGWLSAVTCRLSVGTGLTVYQSAWLRPDDKILAPVRDYLAAHPGAEFLGQETRDDPNMVFGKGILTLYLIPTPSAGVA